MDIRELGRQRNKLLNYRLIMEEFDKHDCTEVPITVIHKKYIYPRFHISRATLYQVLNTDVEVELARVEQAYQSAKERQAIIKQQQLALF